MRKVIFTTLFGGYDELQPAPKYRGWHTILVTDSNPTDSKGWEVVVDKNMVDKYGSKHASRYFKIMAHEVLTGYDLYCHIDANMILVREPPSQPLWGIHRVGRDIYQEANEIHRLKKESFKVLDAQMKKYILEDIRGGFPITENGFHVRRNSESVNRMHEKWWEETKDNSYRDQVSLAYIREVYRWNPEGMTASSIARRYWRFAKAHAPAPLKKESTARVHHITPASFDKNIGKAYNDLIMKLPDQDYVVCRDIDTIPPDHISFIKLCDQIAQVGEYDLISCMTNRVGLEYQLFEGRFSTDVNFISHMNIAKHLAETYKDSVMPTNRTVAGVMMMIRVGTFKKIGGLNEGRIRGEAGAFFDYELCQKVLKAKGKIGIAKGIYLFHNYRLWSTEKNVKRDTKHLD